MFHIYIYIYVDDIYVQCYIYDMYIFISISPVIISCLLTLPVFFKTCGSRRDLSNAIVKGGVRLARVEILPFHFGWVSLKVTS